MTNTIQEKLKKLEAVATFIGSRYYEIDERNGIIKLQAKLIGELLVAVEFFNMAIEHTSGTPDNFYIVHPGAYERSDKAIQSCENRLNQFLGVTK